MSLVLLKPVMKLQNARRISDTGTIKAHESLFVYMGLYLIKFNGLFVLHFERIRPHCRSFLPRLSDHTCNPTDYNASYNADSSNDLSHPGERNVLQSVDPMSEKISKVCTVITRIYFYRLLTKFTPYESCEEARCILKFQIMNHRI